MANHYHKVEICGINTSGLPVLSEQKKKELLQRIRQGDDTARQEMICGNLRLVLSVVQKFAGRGENPDDLFQVGCIGLMKAIDHFDSELNVRFSTYGVPMIIGEIRRHLRDNTPIRVSRSLRDMAYKAMQTKERLSGELGREPTVEEIAKALDVEKKDIVQALEAIVDPISLQEPVYADGGDTIYLMDQVGDPRKDTDWIDELSIRDAMQNLGEREKKILSLRFFVGKTQMEVASEIGISQAQVSRLEKGALSSIKKSIEGK